MDSGLIVGVSKKLSTSYPFIFYESSGITSVLKVPLLAWLKRYLLNRRQFTYVNGTPRLCLQTTPPFYCKGESVDQVSLAIYGALNKLFRWCIENHFTPHPQKCEVMLLSRKPAIGPLPLVKLSGEPINWVNKSRLIGITIDSRLGLTGLNVFATLRKAL